MPGDTLELQFAADPGSWRLFRAEPEATLRESVLEYWEVVGNLDAFRETLLPSGCVELMINLGPPHRILSGAAAGLWRHAWFSGLQERALAIESLHGTHLVAARMHPVGAADLLGSRVAAAANHVVDLSKFLGADGDKLRARVMAAASPTARFAALEDYLLEAQRSLPTVPDFVRAAAKLIDDAHGNLRVARLHEELDVSRKHLAVSFARHLGVSTKAYAKVRRFVWTLAKLRESDTISWSTLATAAGYSDQSHLARDFRRIGAATPTEYLQRRVPDGSALLDPV